MTTTETIELLYQAFQQNPNRLTYSTKTLCKQFAATEWEVQLAKKLYRLNPDDFTVAQALDTDFVYDSIPVSELFETLTGEKEEDYRKKVENWAEQILNENKNTLKKVEKDLFFKSFYYVPTQGKNAIDDNWEVKQKWVKGPEGSQLMVKKEQEVDYKREFQEFVSQYKPRTYKIKDYKNTRNKLAVVCMFDMHLGKIAFKEYTGNIDNLRYQEDYEEEFQKLLWFVKSQQPERILLPIGNDLFNVDNPLLTTVKGTKQDSTSNLYGVFSQALELLTLTIDALVETAPVDVLLVPGNHAATTETYLAIALKNIYHLNTSVSVDDRPITRKYYSYGSNLIGLAHGELPLKKYAELVPYEAKEYFSKAEHIEVLVGDKHIEEMYKTPILDGDGLTVRRLAALTKTDLWHFNQSYSLSKRRSYVLVYDKQRGMELQYTNHAD